MDQIIEAFKACLLSGAILGGSMLVLFVSFEFIRKVITCERINLVSFMVMAAFATWWGFVAVCILHTGVVSGAEVQPQEEAMIALAVFASSMVGELLTFTYYRIKPVNEF